ncbi:MAG: CHRD domain-containing protein [Bacteroidales bacterium]
MKKFMFLFGVVMLAALMGCEKQVVDQDPLNENAAVDSQNSLLKAGHSGMSATAVMQNFRAQLSGLNEVPSNDSRARGEAVFMYDAGMDAVSYKLIVANLENIRMAHIHAAPAGVNGGVVAWLYPASPPPSLIEGATSGILAEGVITADQLVGSMAGMSISDLVDLMNSEEVYVNIHTNQFPGGEIRGQISMNKGMH